MSSVFLCTALAVQKKKKEDMLSLTRIKNLCKQIFPALQRGSPAELVAAATSAAAACVENLVTTNIQKKSSFSLKKNVFLRNLFSSCSEAQNDVVSVKKLKRSEAFLNFLKYFCKKVLESSAAAESGQIVWWRRTDDL